MNTELKTELKTEQEHPVMIASKSNTVTLYFYSSTVKFGHVKLKTYGATDHYPNGVTIDVHPKHVQGASARFFQQVKVDDNRTPSSIVNLHGIRVDRVENLWHQIENNSKSWDLFENNSSNICHLLLAAGGFYDYYDNVPNGLKLNDVYKLVFDSVKVACTTAAAIATLYSVGINNTADLQKILIAGGYLDAFVELPKDINKLISAWVQTQSNLHEKVTIALERQAGNTIESEGNFQYDPAIAPSNSCCIL